MKAFAALFILACVLVGASLNANLLQMRVGPGTPVTYQGPGDIAGVNAIAVSYWGVAAYSYAIGTAGTAAAVLLTRSSDSATCNLLVTSTGDPATTTSGCGVGGDNGSSVATWCAASGGHCTANLSDQKGSRALSSTDASSYPTFVTAGSCAGTSKPCLSYDGTTMRLFAPVAATYNQPFTIALIVNADVGVTATGSPFSDGYVNGIFTNTVTVSVPNYYALAHGSPVGIPTVSGNWYSVIGVFNGASSVLRVNGTEAAGNSGAPGGDPFSPGVAIGGDGTYWFKGKIEEAVLMQGALGSGDRALLETQRRAFYGF